jgi:hypothetical protein
MPGFFMSCLQHSLRFRFAVRNLLLSRFAGQEVARLHSHLQRKFRQDGARVRLCRFSIPPSTYMIITSSDNSNNQLIIVFFLCFVFS